MADNTDKLPSALQESIATAVAFATDDNGVLISNTIEISTFDSPYDDIVARCIEHRKKYHRAPGKQHIDDVFATILEDKTHKQNAAYHRIITAMLRQADGLDTLFIASKVSDFTRIRLMRAGIAEAVERYQKGGEGVTEDLEAIFRKCLRIRQGNKDYGFTEADDEALKFLDRDVNDFCQIGIPELDIHGCHPARTELLVFIAARNRGKSWWMHHIGKYAMMKGWRILHYTLENSPEMTSQRYFQSLFSGVKREGDYHYTILGEDNSNDSPKKEKLVPKFIVENREKTRSYLKHQVKEMGYRLENIRVRSFPTGQLSFAALEKDLDEIALVHKFYPDILLIDSPQLMKFDRKQEYIGLGELFINLRGLAVERNLSVVATHQGNRSAERSGTVYGHQISGSIDIIGIADNVITYSQTTSEEEHGLARLYLQKVRNDTARSTILISQHYPSGQFCLDSRYLTNQLRDTVRAYIGYQKGGEDDAEDDFEPERHSSRR